MNGILPNFYIYTYTHKIFYPIHESLRRLMILHFCCEETITNFFFLAENENVRLLGEIEKLKKEKEEMRMASLDRADNMNVS